MLEFHRDRFVQLLHEVPAKETILSEPKYSPYLQTVMDTVKKDGVCGGNANIVGSSC